ncbi:MAG: hypothetical protein Q4A01_03265 [Coriobacteriales bacterium]|nr:hypothetical protein [Coriobacteriales bacterium]
MNVLLVFNDGLIESFDTKDDMTQEYTHAQLMTYVEEDDDRDDVYEVGIELIPIIHSKSRDLPTIRRICSTTFISEYEHHSRPSFDVVCRMMSGLKQLIVDGAVIWEGNPEPYLSDESYLNEMPEGRV